jgi:hypothetical protein
MTWEQLSKEMDASDYEVLYSACNKRGDVRGLIVVTFKGRRAVISYLGLTSVKKLSVFLGKVEEYLGKYLLDEVYVPVRHINSNEDGKLNVSAVLKDVFT